jgi:hypothetical protein
MFAPGIGTTWREVRMPLKGMLLVANLLVWMAAAYEVGATFS